MSQIANHIRKNFYLDSVALMRLSIELSAVDGVSNASMMSGTPSNLQILDDAGLLNADGRAAKAEDLVIAIEASDVDQLSAALSEAENLLLRIKTKTAGGSLDQSTKTLERACELQPDSNLALISVPGEFAVREARQAIDAGLNVMIFSDNIAIDDELELKIKAHERGVIVMGPDCGTALIQGVPLAFANHVPRGDVGIIAASGTGLQEVSCLLAHGGRGISHAFGTGGRDLTDAIGGLTTLAAIDILASDDDTRELILISKPAGEKTRDKILDRLRDLDKPTTICFIGEPASDTGNGVRFCRSLADTAAAVLNAPANGSVASDDLSFPTLEPGRTEVHGLFVGGTLCAEAQLLFLDAGLSVSSNVPIPGALAISEPNSGHQFLDLGADEYTLGRPHPMIEPAVRTPALEQSLADNNVAVILLDLVLGTGGHHDPAASVASTIGNFNDAIVIASVCGTDQDPQSRTRQIEALKSVGVVVAPSNAEAANKAAQIVKALGS